jgi:DNA invertase Pin-like site-specific DNA recombinase
MDRKTKPQQELALIYVRVSSLRQAEEGLSLEAQERTLRAQAEADGYQVEVIREEGRSGKSVKNRPALLAALNKLNKGEASALYVTKLDRLARSLSDLLTIVTQADRKEWRLKILELNLDTRTPQGRLVLSMLGAVAEFERSLISARQKDVHTERTAKGEVWGVTKGCKPKTAASTRKRVLDLHKQGHSLRAIAATLTSENIPTAYGGQWRASTIAHLLKSPSLNLV